MKNVHKEAIFNEIAHNEYFDAIDRGLISREKTFLMAIKAAENFSRGDASSLISDISPELVRLISQSLKEDPVFIFEGIAVPEDDSELIERINNLTGGEFHDEDGAFKIDPNILPRLFNIKGSIDFRIEEDASNIDSAKLGLNLISYVNNPKENPLTDKVMNRLLIMAFSKIGTLYSEIEFLIENLFIEHVCELMGPARGYESQRTLLRDLREATSTFSVGSGCDGISKYIEKTISKILIDDIGFAIGEKLKDENASSERFRASLDEIEEKYSQIKTRLEDRSLRLFTEHVGNGRFLQFDNLDDFANGLMKIQTRQTKDFSEKRNASIEEMEVVGNRVIDMSKIIQSRHDHNRPLFKDYIEALDSILYRVNATLGSCFKLNADLFSEITRDLFARTRKILDRKNRDFDNEVAIEILNNTSSWLETSFGNEEEAKLFARACLSLFKNSNPDLFHESRISAWIIAKLTNKPTTPKDEFYRKLKDFIDEETKIRLNGIKRSFTGKIADDFQKGVTRIKPISPTQMEWADYISIAVGVFRVSGDILNVFERIANVLELANSKEIDLVKVAKEVGDMAGAAEKAFLESEKGLISKSDLQGVLISAADTDGIDSANLVRLFSTAILKHANSRYNPSGEAEHLEKIISKHYQDSVKMILDNINDTLKAQRASLR